MSWLDKVLEAAEEEVTDVLDKAIDSNDEEVDLSDLSQAGTEVQDADVSNDPEEDVYDKVGTYSQAEYVGDEDIDGYKDTDIDSNDSDVEYPEEDNAVSEMYLSKKDLDNLYTEAVLEVIAENEAAINQKFTDKINEGRLASTKENIKGAVKDAGEAIGKAAEKVKRAPETIAKTRAAKQAGSTALVATGQSQGLVPVDAKKKFPGGKAGKIAAGVAGAAALGGAAYAAKKALDKKKKKDAVKEAFDQFIDSMDDDE